ncbi:MAG: hypothetical protein M3Z20_03145 [Chloroflexota bacterium]|nr:hypothetical protein [Chloroflexota bacterium]
MPTFGCAYWGRDVDVADRDFASLSALGFSWVVIPISTERMRYDRVGAAAVMAAAKRNGLATRIAPWGVGGIFGGEGIVEAGQSPDATLAWWLACAHEVTPDAMFWDEPHGPQAVRSMAEAMRTADVAGAAQYLYINPDRSEWPVLPAAHTLAGIGIDAYRTPEAAITLLPNVREQYGIPVHVWVRNFGLSRSETLRPANDLDALLDAGVTDIGVWGFPSAGCSCLDNAEPQRAWNAIAETIVRCGEARAA